MSVALIRPLPKSDPRDEATLRKHYETEKKLADKLRNASRSDRLGLYTKLYDELFAALPDMPFLQKGRDAELGLKKAKKELAGIKPFLKPDSVCLEIGPGAGNLTRLLAGHSKKCIAVDVSAAPSGAFFPENVEFVISDGVSIPAAPGSVDLAYSNQLMEHLHPDDAEEQLKNIFAALKPGGCYICRTPSRLTGPYDVSRYFDRVATGFHLREYTYHELVELLRMTGFRKFKRLICERGIYLGHYPVAPFIIAEKIFERLPENIKFRLSCNRLAEIIFNVTLIAYK